MREERRCPCYLEDAVIVMVPSRIVRSRLDRRCEAKLTVSCDVFYDQCVHSCRTRLERRNVPLVPGTP
jgi:hypothetical protein